RVFAVFRRARLRARRDFAALLRFGAAFFPEADFLRAALPGGAVEEDTGAPPSGARIAWSDARTGGAAFAASEDAVAPPRLSFSAASSPTAKSSPSALIVSSRKAES